MLEKSGQHVSRFKRDKFDIPVAIVATLFFIFLYMFAMDLVLHNWDRIFWLSIFLLVGGIILYFLWWKQLK